MYVMGLFLDLLFCTIDRFTRLYVGTILSWSLQLYNKSWNHVVLVLQLLFYFPKLFLLFWSFVFSYEFFKWLVNFYTESNHIIFFLSTYSLIVCNYHLKPSAPDLQSSTLPGFLLHRQNQSHQRGVLSTLCHRIYRLTFPWPFLAYVWSLPTHLGSDPIPVSEFSNFSSFSLSLQLPSLHWILTSNI